MKEMVTIEIQEGWYARNAKQVHRNGNDCEHQIIQRFMYGTSSRRVRQTTNTIESERTLTCRE